MILEGSSSHKNFCLFQSLNIKIENSKEGRNCGQKKPKTCQNSL
jgi:hypothetical protein